MVNKSYFFVKNNKSWTQNLTILALKLADQELLENKATGSLKTAKLQVGNRKSVKNRSRSGQIVMTLLFTEVRYCSKIYKKKFIGF